MLVGGWGGGAARASVDENNDGDYGEE